jgi:hypothetical protein
MRLPESSEGSCCVDGDALPPPLTGSPHAARLPALQLPLSSLASMGVDFRLWIFFQIKNVCGNVTIVGVFQENKK